MSRQPQLDRQHAARLLKIYGGETDDFFKLWPADKQFFFSHDAKAFIAYGVRHKVAVCMGDPAGRRKSIGPLLGEFRQYCAQQQWLMIFIQATDTYRDEYRRNGLQGLLIGADAVIELEPFVLQTIHNKYFRNIVNRFEKRDFTVRKYLPPHTPGLLHDVQAVSDSWLRLAHRKEWAFLAGRMEGEYLQQVPVYVLRDAHGVAQAFANELPPFKPGIATIDLMRHRTDAPNNSIDYLFIKLLTSLHEEGYESFNLGLSPLDSHPLPTDRRARLLLGFYKLSNRFIGFKGLHQFKAKYGPEWEPRYIWHQGGLLQLLRMGRAVYDLMKYS